MPTLRHPGGSVAVQPGETVLEALERAGAGPTASCRSGVCQSCLLRAVEGDVPVEAQVGLRDTWQAQGLFLACVCRPAGDLVVQGVDDVAPALPTRVLARERLAPDVLGLSLAVPEGFQWQPGQYVSLIRPSDGLTRPFSLASRPDDARLELHVRRVSGGSMSPWLFDLPDGAPLRIRGPLGHCIYAGDIDQPLILAGTGTGLAPLVGVLREALARGHQGPITLYHGSREASGLYLGDTLARLAETHPHVRVRRLALDGAADGVETGRLDDAVLGAGHDLARSRAWLCGGPAFVQRMKRELFLEGMPLRAIAADAFVQAPADR